MQLVAFYIWYYMIFWKRRCPSWNSGFTVRRLKHLKACFESWAAVDQPPMTKCTMCNVKGGRLMLNYKHTQLYKALKCCSGHCFLFFTVRLLHCRHSHNSYLSHFVHLISSGSGTEPFKTLWTFIRSSEIACVSTSFERNNCCQVCIINWGHCAILTPSQIWHAHFLVHTSVQGQPASYLLTFSGFGTSLFLAKMLRRMLKEGTIHKYLVSCSV